jgi:hypothetical protein
MVALLALLCGCGESIVFSLDPGHIDESSLAPHACFVGAEIELVRYSTQCERASAKPLTAAVGDGLEFAAEAVKTLEVPCAGGPSPAVEIQIEEHQLVFDFSNVTSAGRFPRADFEGYVIDFALEENHALLIAATVDAERSTLPIRSADIFHEPDHIEVNFQDLAYDQAGFLAIDLLFASVSPTE